MSKEYKHWNTEKKPIPVMIRTYCRGNHKPERKAEGVKRNKGFCSYCKIHCYKPEYRAEMKEVMKYSGPKMLFSHPIFAMSHVTAMIKYKKQLKKQAKRQSDKNAGAEKVRSAQTNDQKKDKE